MERGSAWQGMARGMCVHITALLKGFKPRDLEERTAELLHPPRPLLSQEIATDFSLLQQKDGPRSEEGLGGCETHGVAKRADGELENPSPGNVDGQVQPRQ